MTLGLALPSVFTAQGEERSQNHVSHHVGAGCRSQVFCKSRHCSYLVRHLHYLSANELHCFILLLCLSSRSCYVALAQLEVMKIPLPPPLNCWDYTFFFFKSFSFSPSEFVYSFLWYWGLHARQIPGY